MAVTATPVLLQTPIVGNVQCVPADTTSAKTVYTGATNGTKIVSLIATSTDTVARIFGIYVAGFQIGAVSIPPLSGTDGTAPTVDLLLGGSLSLLPGLPVDNDGQRYIFLASTNTLTVACTTTVTAAKLVNFVAFGASF